MLNIKPALLTWGIVSLTGLLVDPLMQEANWHQWRGPNADGVACQNSNPPSTWSETDNIAWKVPIAGEGSSTPIIWGDHVYLVAAIATDEKPDVKIEPHPETLTVPPENIFDFKVLCLERRTGNLVWEKTLASAAPKEGRHDSTTYASASPTTDGEHLFVSFGSYGVFCLTLEGEMVWSRDLGDMRTRRGWGGSRFSSDCRRQAHRNVGSRGAVQNFCAQQSRWHDGLGSGQKRTDDMGDPANR